MRRTFIGLHGGEGSIRGWRAWSATFLVIVALVAAPSPAPARTKPTSHSRRVADEQPVPMLPQRAVNLGLSLPGEVVRRDGDVTVSRIDVPDSARSDSPGVPATE